MKFLITERSPSYVFYPAMGAIMWGRGKNFCLKCILRVTKMNRKCNLLNIVSFTKLFIYKHMCMYTTIYSYTYNRIGK